MSAAEVLADAARSSADDPIAAVELRRVAFALGTPQRAAHGTEAVREVVIVRVLGADGAAGWGECPTLAHAGYGHEHTAVAWRELTEVLAPSLVASETLPPGRPSMARAAVVDACTDRHLRRRGLALADVLGVAGHTVAGGVVLGIDASVDALVARAGAARAAGAALVKCKVAPGWAEVPLTAVVSAIDAPVAADANGAFAPSAPELARLDAVGLAYLEQPVATLGPDDADRLRTPVALDEGVGSADDARRWLAASGRVVNLKPARVGGVAAAVALIDATAASPGRLFVGGMLESGLGRTSAVAVAAYLAARDPSAFPTDLGPSQRYVDEDLTDDVVVDDHGRLVVGGGLGLGAAPHPRRLAAATVELVTVQA